MVGLDLLEAGVNISLYTGNP